ncbi:transcriptional coactivator PipX [Acaryochloris sp. IP29b_bin.148]|uniref:transcriptional coactivator PipX n=1 Tax=Acaryochloris sp. IP29b_bin.148 TaxID=2969218 RepID=UPI00261A0C8B|nr:PipX family protein [Acaryochloris sp. IP29b_bin.148]
MITETYLNHPTFGLLFSLCLIDSESALYTTLYAQRLFFVVTISERGLEFSAISRQEARVTVESRLRILRRSGSRQDYDQLQLVHQQTFP